MLRHKWGLRVECGGLRLLDQFHEEMGSEARHEEIIRAWGLNKPLKRSGFEQFFKSLRELVSIVVLRDVGSSIRAELRAQVSVAI
jgi:hypothetical protein